MTSFRDLKIGWRILCQKPAYSAVVVFSLSIGFAAFFLLLGLVRHSFSYEKHIPDSENIYVVKNRFNFVGNPEWKELVALPFRDVVMRSGLVLASTAVVPLGPISMRVGDEVHQVELPAVDPAFQQVFGIQPVEGDLHAALTRPDAIALTLDTAQKLFGQTHVVGKTLQINGKPYLVAAILRDPPATTTLPYAALTGIQTNVWQEQDRKHAFEDWSQNSCRIYIKLAGDTPSAALDRMLQKTSDNSPLRALIPAEVLQRLDHGKMIDIRLGRFSDAYFDSDVAHASDSGKRGNQRIVFGLAGMALLILLLATTNYVNLATVRTIGRQREIGVRKVLGASAMRITSQFLTESVLVALLATVFGLLFAWLLLPLFSDLVDRQLNAIFTIPIVVCSLAFGFMVGLAAGIYPTWIARRFKATHALADRGNGESPGGLWLRRILTVLQFAVAMGLTAFTLAIAWQAEYASKFNPGFDPGPLLVIDLPDFMVNPTSQAFRQALMSTSGVDGAAVSTHAVGRDRWPIHNSFKRSGGSPASLELKGVGPDFFKLYGIAPVAGRLFDPAIDPEESVDLGVINRSAAYALGYASPEVAVGKMLAYHRPVGADGIVKIIGIAPDIRNETLHEMPRPTAYYLTLHGSKLTVRVGGNMAEVRTAIEAIWHQHFPNDVLRMERSEFLFSQNYADDLRLAKLMAASATIAISIAVFGIYVLSAYSIQRRAREIILRKLHGANRRDIARFIGTEFIVLVGIAAAIGLPIAALATERYLAGFVERAPIGIWTLLIAFAVTAFTAFAATWRHTLAAMRMAPSSVLRN